jgi:hypothetical protein
MELIEYFQAFMDKEVNLNPDRIKRLDERTEAITNFLKGHNSVSDHFLDVIPQGSYAHKTIIKPVRDTDEFDADLLLYVTEFEGWQPKDYVENLYWIFRDNGIYRDMVSRKTRCITIDYAGDFHIDVVPYLERHSEKYVTNRHENRFELTDPEKYNAWLDDKNRIANQHFVKVIRLVKYLRNYKSTFSVKSIILNVLLGEQVSDVALLEDPNCYGDIPTTLRTVMNRLSAYVKQNELLPTILDPSGTYENFGDRWDQEGYTNFRKWMMHYADKINEAYLDQNLDSSLTKWQEIFGTCFKAPDPSALSLSESNTAVIFDKTEQQITDLGFQVALDPRFKVKVKGLVLKKPGYRNYELSSMGNKVGRGRNIQFSIAHCTVPPPYNIYWKVLNRGENAKAQNCIRGQIEKGGNIWRVQEPTSFRGSHYVECYIVKNDVCVAKDQQAVIIT